MNLLAGMCVFGQLRPLHRCKRSTKNSNKQICQACFTFIGQNSPSKSVAYALHSEMQSEESFASLLSQREKKIGNPEVNKLIDMLLESIDGKKFLERRSNKQRVINSSISTSRISPTDLSVWIKGWKSRMGFSPRKGHEYFPEEGFVTVKGDLAREFGFASSTQLQQIRSSAVSSEKIVADTGVLSDASPSIMQGNDAWNFAGT